MKQGPGNGFFHQNSIKLARSRGKFAWLNGMSGGGKTVLSSLVIEDIKELCALTRQGGLAYFYCDLNDATKERPLLMLQSVLAQLTNPESPVPLDLIKLY